MKPLARIAATSRTSLRPAAAAIARPRTSAPVVKPDLSDLAELVAESEIGQPFRFVVWLPVRGATAVDSGPFAAALGGSHSAARGELEAGRLADWDNALSPLFRVWWALYPSELGTVPAIAYAAKQMGL